MCFLLIMEAYLQKSIGSHFLLLILWSSRYLSIRLLDPFKLFSEGFDTGGSIFNQLDMPHSETIRGHSV